MNEQEKREPVVIRDNRKIDRPDAPADATIEADPVTVADGAAPTASSPDGVSDAAATDAAEPSADAVLLEERTRDLQRVSAEYANYRRRADRDRLAAGDVAVGRVLTELLPVVDDLDRARTHGDLSGPLKAVADKIDAVFDKLGLEAFGEIGDPFDPSRHEAVLHDESDAVTVPTCTTIMRRGYQHRDRLIRAAMVGVSEPVPGAGPALDDAVQDATAGQERTTGTTDTPASEPSAEPPASAPQEGDPQPRSTDG